MANRENKPKNYPDPLLLWKRFLQRGCRDNNEVKGFQIRISISRKELTREKNKLSLIDKTTEA